MNYSRIFKSVSLYRNYCTPVKIAQRKAAAAVPKGKKCLVPPRPLSSKIDLSKLPPRTKIDADTIAHLERLSLVDCANKKGIETLEDAIRFADQIFQVDTAGIEPLITVLEDRPLFVREDKVTDGNCRKDILSNASVTEEEYFVAPPGNIPLEQRSDLLHQNEEPNNTDLKEQVLPGTDISCWNYKSA